MSNFEWHTDEDGDWEELPLPPFQLKPGKKRWFFWPLVLIGCCLVGWISYQRLEQRVEEVSSFVVEDILSSYELRQQAITSHDGELFNSVLSGSSVQWMETHQALFEQALTLDRWPLGLQLQPDTSHLLTITPTANLKAAELIVVQEYISLRPDGVQESVTLQHTDVYRLGRQRWLFAPPTSDFWGGWLTEDGRFLTLIYPQRDQAIAQQLLSDFDHHLTTYCALPHSQCPADMHLLVRLGTNPQSLLDLSNPSLAWHKTTVLEMPTPSLIGLPIDDGGYQALMRGYSQQLIAATIRANSGWECCEQGLFHQALIDKQLNQLGLKAWPLTSAMYATIFHSPVAGIDQLHRYWFDPPATPLSGNIWPQIYGAVDFILYREPDASLAEMQRTLLMTETYTDWLYDYTTPNISNATFQREWLFFAESHLGADSAAPPPNQDILLLCRATSQRTNQSSIFHYDPVAGTITPELTRRNFLFMASLPQDDGVLLHERQVMQNRTQILLWQNNEEIPAYYQPLSVGIFHVEPINDSLTLYGYDFTAGESLLDVLTLANCDATHCPAQRLIGTPYWSPDGRYALLISDNSHLRLADAQGNILHDIGLGATPFWLDETHYGYAHVAGNLARTPAELLVTAVTDNNPQPWLPLAQLADALPDPLHLSHLTLRAVTVAPHNPNLLFIATNVRTRQSELRTVLFQYNRLTDEVELIYTSPYTLGFYKPLTFSPDGHWLTTTTFASTSTLSDLFIYHIPTSEPQILGSNHLFSALEYDWSADSQWLLRLENGFLHLIEPATGQQKVFIHELSGCSYATWVNK